MKPMVTVVGGCRWSIGTHHAYPLLVRPKLPTDEPGHPYGQWSLLIEPLSVDHEGIATVTATFVSPAAPPLTPGTFLLYYGIDPIGTMTVGEPNAQG